MNIEKIEKKTNYEIVHFVRDHTLY